MKTKMEQLHEWLKEIVPDKYFTEKYIQSSAGSGNLKEIKMKYIFYTETNIYFIIAIDRRINGGYLGCMSTPRKPLAGENLTRGNDLPDGSFNKKTWNKIKNSIIKNELVELSKEK